MPSRDGRCVSLVTGGTGTLGQALVARLLEASPGASVRVFSRDELKQEEMSRAFAESQDRLHFVLGDVRDLDRIRWATKGVDQVFHAAAIKQVAACERNPREAVLTNVIGSQNVIDAALEAEVPRVLAVSTDKAVNPISIYGATKLCAEKLFVQANCYPGRERPTIFSVVRYGNVVGSRGSVIPLFLDQAKTGRLTITDPRMTRFWITIDAASRFVLRCMEELKGGEIFVPKIPSVRVVDLAAVIAPGAKLEQVGIRPGEKLHECLITEDESRTVIELEDRFEIHPQYPWWTEPRAARGRPVADGFRYASDANSEWLDRDRLGYMVEAFKAHR